MCGLTCLIADVRKTLLLNFSFVKLGGHRNLQEFAFLLKLGHQDDILNCGSLVRLLLQTLLNYFCEIFVYIVR